MCFGPALGPSEFNALGGNHRRPTTSSATSRCLGWPLPWLASRRNGGRFSGSSTRLWAAASTRACRYRQTPLLVALGVHTVCLNAGHHLEGVSAGCWYHRSNHCCLASAIGPSSVGIKPISRKNVLIGIYDRHFSADDTRREEGWLEVGGPRQHADGLVADARAKKQLPTRSAHEVFAYKLVEN